jgi:hypothetical protein
MDPGGMPPFVVLAIHGPEQGMLCLAGKQSESNYLLERKPGALLLLLSSSVGGARLGAPILQC